MGVSPFQATRSSLCSSSDSSDIRFPSLNQVHIRDSDGEWVLYHRAPQAVLNAKVGFWSPSAGYMRPQCPHAQRDTRLLPMQFFGNGACGVEPCASHPRPPPFRLSCPLRSSLFQFLEEPGTTRVLLNLANSSLLLLDWTDAPDNAAGPSVGHGGSTSAGSTPSGTTPIAPAAPQGVHMIFNEAYGDLVSYDWMLGLYVLVGFSTGVVVIASIDGGEWGVAPCRNTHS